MLHHLNYKVFHLAAWQAGERGCYLRSPLFAGSILGYYNAESAIRSIVLQDIPVITLGFCDGVGAIGSYCICRGCSTNNRNCYFTYIGTQRTSLLGDCELDTACACSAGGAHCGLDDELCRATACRGIIGNLQGVDAIIITAKCYPILCVTLIFNNCRCTHRGCHSKAYAAAHCAYLAGGRIDFEILALLDDRYLERFALGGHCYCTLAAILAVVCLCCNNNGLTTAATVLRQGEPTVRHHCAPTVGYCYLNLLLRLGPAELKAAIAQVCSYALLGNCYILIDSDAFNTNAQCCATWVKGVILGRLQGYLRAAPVTLLRGDGKPLGAREYCPCNIRFNGEFLLSTAICCKVIEHAIDTQ